HTISVRDDAYSLEPSSSKLWGMKRRCFQNRNCSSSVRGDDVIFSMNERTTVNVYHFAVELKPTAVAFLCKSSQSTEVFAILDSSLAPLIVGDKLSSYAKTIRSRFRSNFSWF